MEEKENIAGSDFSQKNGNLKPFLSVFIILIIILSVYYLFWRSISVALKNAVIDKLKGNEYSSIVTSGFPFYKKLEIRDLKVVNNFLALTKNKIEIKKVEVSSFIFSRKFKLNYEDLSIFDVEDNINYKLVYNDVPNISFSLYSNGALKDFSYSDIGYRVIDNNSQTFYTSGNSNFQIQTIKNENTIDYSILGDMQNMQNFQIVNSKNKIDVDKEPEIYNLKFDISSSITKDEEDKILNSVVKVSNFSLVSNKNDVVNIIAEIYNDKNTPYSYGEMQITLKDYNKLLNQYKKSIIEALNLEKDSSIITEDEIKEYILITDKIFATVEDTIKKNPDTKNGNGVVIIKKEKNVNDYVINGQSLFLIMQSLV